MEIYHTVARPALPSAQRLPRLQPVPSFCLQLRGLLLSRRHRPYFIPPTATARPLPTILPHHRPHYTVTPYSTPTSKALITKRHRVARYRSAPPSVLLHVAPTSLSISSRIPSQRLLRNSHPTPQTDNPARCFYILTSSIFCSSRSCPTRSTLPRRPKQKCHAHRPPRRTRATMHFLNRQAPLSYRPRKSENNSHPRPRSSPLHRRPSQCRMSTTTPTTALGVLPSIKLVPCGP